MSLEPLTLTEPQREQGISSSWGCLYGSMSFTSGAENSLNQRASQDQRAWTEGGSCPTSSRALCPERFVRSKPAPVQQGIEPIYHLEALETKQEEQSTSSKFCVCALGSIRAQCELSPMEGQGEPWSLSSWWGSLWPGRDQEAPCMGGDCPEGLGLGMALCKPGRLCSDVKR